MKTSNPYSNTKKRKAALKWMAARGITQVRALYPSRVALPLARPMYVQLVGRMVRAS